MLQLQLLAQLQIRSAWPNLAAAAWDYLRSRTAKIGIRSRALNRRAIEPPIGAMFLPGERCCCWLPDLHAACIIDVTRTRRGRQLDSWRLSRVAFRHRRRRRPGIKFLHFCAPIFESRAFETLSEQYYNERTKTIQQRSTNCAAATDTIANSIISFRQTSSLRVHPSKVQTDRLESAARARQIAACLSEGT